MIRKDISKNYELVEDSIDSKKPQVKYIGAYYYELLKPSKTLFCLLFTIAIVIQIAMYIVPLCINIPIFHSTYFTIPYVLQIMPILILGLNAYKSIFKEYPYKETQKKDIFTKSPIFCIVQTILSISSIICYVVYSSKNKLVQIEYFPLISILVMLISSILLLMLFKFTKLKSNDNENKKVETNDILNQENNTDSEEKIEEESN